MKQLWKSGKFSLKITLSGFNWCFDSVFNKFASTAPPHDGSEVLEIYAPKTLLYFDQICSKNSNYFAKITKISIKIAKNIKFSLIFQKCELRRRPGRRLRPRIPKLRPTLQAFLWWPHAPHPEKLPTGYFFIYVSCYFWKNSLPYFSI